MPSGTAISVAPPVTISVPRIAGPMPGPGLRDTTGMVSVKKSGKPRNAIAAPRSITADSTAISGIATGTTVAIIRPIISWFLTVRHEARARRSMLCGPRSSAGFSGRGIRPLCWIAANGAVMCPGSASSSVARSPLARPSPSITAPTSPPLLCGSTEARIISQRVAPSASAASFSDGGVVSMTSRDSDVMIGVIMIARMIPAVRNERPSPKCCDSTSTPHRPNTTDGTTASRSIRYTIGFLSRGGATWVMNSATPRLTGTASASAIAAVYSVPHTNGSAPKMSSAGDHRVEVKNALPNAGHARRVMTTAIMPRIRSTSPAAAIARPRKARSAYCRWPRSSDSCIVMPPGCSGHLDLVELRDRLVGQALGQRREVELLGQLLSVREHVAEEVLERGALGLVGLLHIRNTPRRRRDRIGTLALRIDRHIREIVLHIDTVARARGGLRAGLHELACLVLHARVLQCARLRVG